VLSAQVCVECANVKGTGIKCADLQKRTEMYDSVESSIEWSERMRESGKEVPQRVLT
jgi:hypothetical protein